MISKFKITKNHALICLLTMVLIAVFVICVLYADRQSLQQKVQEENRKEARHQEILTGIESNRQGQEHAGQQQKEDAAAHAKTLERIERALKDSEENAGKLKAALAQEREDREQREDSLERQMGTMQSAIAGLKEANEKNTKLLRSLNACRVGQDGEVVLFEAQVQTGTLKLTYFLYFKEEREKPTKEFLKALRDLHEATRGKIFNDKEADIEPIDAKTGETLLTGPKSDRFHASKSTAWLVSFERKNPRGLKEAYEKPVEDQKKLQSVQWLKVHRSGVKVAWYAKASAEDRAKLTEIIHFIALQLGCQPTAARWVEDDRKSEEDKSFDVLEFGR